MCCQRQCLDVLLPVEEVLTAGADDDYTRSHVWGIVRKLGMRDVKEESRESCVQSSRSRQKSEGRGNKCRGRDSMVGSFVDWRGREMPRWSPWSARLASGVVLRRMLLVEWVGGLEGVHGYVVGQGRARGGWWWKKLSRGGSPSS
jgi:hypothetical protein